jgi:uncharacterized membrane protein YeaQ/YmgE (transglycosylase-associated protein family)
MGLIILIIVGALLGWLGSIVFRRESRSGILTCMLAGTAGALAGGALNGSVPLLAGIAPMQLIWAVLGASVAVVAAHFFRRHITATDRR